MSARFGFVVRGELGGAVRRNQVKRRVRSAVDHLAPRLGEGFDCVMVARAGGEREFQNMVSDIFQIMERAGVLRADRAKG